MNRKTGGKSSNALELFGFLLKKSLKIIRFSLISYHNYPHFPALAQFLKVEGRKRKQARAA